METPHAWQVGPGRTLALDEPRLIGVLNVTPDSFSDGGLDAGPAEAVNRGLQLLDDGAAAIDVGPESTRPGARRVPAAEQIVRAIPVIEGLRAATDAVLSIDTTRREVAEAALDAGCDVINDVSAASDDPTLLALAAQRGCGLILMHRLRAPEADRYSDQYDEPPVYEDVVGDVRAYLLERAAAAVDAGVAPGAIVVDPGLGFGKTVAQNYQLIAGIGDLMADGFPVLSAASRKSFLGAVTGVSPPAARDAASLAVTLAHWGVGVRLFRVHNVAAHRGALAVAAALAGVQV